MTNPQDPVFPGTPWDGTLQAAVTPRGLTKREYFAAMAMQGLCADLARSVEGYHLIKRLEKKAGEDLGNLSTCQNIARNSLAFADALIAELSK